jgi:hypothetical protein
MRCYSGSESRDYVACFTHLIERSGASCLGLTDAPLMSRLQWPAEAVVVKFSYRIRATKDADLELNPGRTAE